MFSGSALAVFLVATIALNLSPGPDMLYVISRSLGQGRRAGIVSALGIGVGTLFHTLVTALGISALLLLFPIAYNLIRYAGAAYLAYLGIRMLLSSRRLEDPRPETVQQNLSAVFKQGVLTNVFNPKVALFFLAFLPQFVDKTSESFALQIVALGLIFDTSGTTWNIFVAMLAGRASEKLQEHTRLSSLQRIVPGLILLGLALVVFVG